KASIMRDTFNPAVSNLNVHLDKNAYEQFKRDWKESNPFGLTSDSRHSPVHVSMKEVIDDREEMERRISNCDINKHWSAMCVMINDNLYGYFCEIAGSQAILFSNPNTGIRI